MLSQPDGRSRPRRRFSTALPLALFAVVSVATLVVGASEPPTVSAAAAEPSSFVVSGVGHGHGRGLSQWGAYGRAVNGGQSWQTILNAYYGGTTSGSRPNSSIRVRLKNYDTYTTLGVISAPGTARWTGAGGATSSGTFKSLYAQQTGSNTFDVYGLSSALACPGGTSLPLPNGTYSTASPVSAEVAQIQTFLNAYGFESGTVDGDFGPITASAVKRFQAASGLSQTGVWTTAERDAAVALMASATGASWSLIGSGVAGPIEFTTTTDTAAAAPGDVLGVCDTNGGVNHYRGSIKIHYYPNDNRVVNTAPIESYLRGVVPREVIASWGSAGGGAGMNALKAQAVAARSYALSESRYTYAETCDTGWCQVYGGSAVRSSPTSKVTVRESGYTDTAVAGTAGVVRVWPNGSVVATEFSDSNGPRTAGGAFPPVDDPWDDVPGNTRHTWERTISAADVAKAYGLSSLRAVATEADPSSQFDGIWANRVRLTSTRTVSAWDFRQQLGLPSPGFTIKAVYPTVNESACMPANADTFAMIGDSVGVHLTEDSSSALRVKLDDAFRTVWYDSVVGRPTDGGGQTNGVDVAAEVPVGTEVVLVELGYNDSPQYLASRIDTMMNALKARSVGKVLWSNLSEIDPKFAEANDALDLAAARWSNLTIVDWRSASMAHPKWFADGIHLTAAGERAFAAVVTQQIGETFGVPNGPCLKWSAPAPGARSLRWVSALGHSGVPASLDKVSAVVLEVSVVKPSSSGAAMVWECGAPRPKPWNFRYAKGETLTNTVVLAVGASGNVCVRASASSHLVVDIVGWFDETADVHLAAGTPLDTRLTTKLKAGVPRQVELLGAYRIPSNPASVDGVALNVTSIYPRTTGSLTVSECGSRSPKRALKFYRTGLVYTSAVVLPLVGSRKICLTATQDTHAILTTTAWFGPGTDLRLSRERAFDSRTAGTPLAAGAQRQFSLASVTQPGDLGVMLKTSMYGPTRRGHLSVSNCAGPMPDTWWLSFPAYRIRVGHSVLAFDADRSACVRSDVQSGLVADVATVFGPGSGLHPAADRLLDTRFATS